MKMNSNSKEVSQNYYSINIFNSFYFICIGKFMQLPLNRIRQIINLDPESKMISKEALLIIAKATESFIQDLGGVCGQIAKTQKRKTLLMQDLLLATE